MAPFAQDEQGRHSLYWSAYAACKRGISCDLDSPRGQDLLRRLVASADFLIESEDPGVMARRGLDYASLRAINPALIHVSITPFGSAGPKAGYAATDLTLWASGGPLLPTREPGKRPLRIAAPQAFLHASADAAGGALVAHFARLRNGRGQHVDISVQQSAAQSTLSSILSAAVGHEDFSIRPEVKNTKKKPLDLSGSGARTRRSKWPVRDGLVELHLAMGPAAGRFTNNLFAWMREEGAIDPDTGSWDWVTLPARIESDEIDDDRIEAAREAVARFLAVRSKQELVEQAIRRKILLAPVATVEDLINSPHHAARGFFQTVEETGGDGARARRVTLPGQFAFTMNGGASPFVAVTPAPRIGQHNAEVYGTLCGLSAADLEQLHQTGVI
jgi:crotonobetainyl-CoA:carnitine CoA-transferase CaiB-like acyl-CoA transferase